MLSTIVISLVLSQTNVVTMAAPPFSTVGIPSAIGTAWQNRFVSRMCGDGLKITTASDIQQVLGLERQKQLLGCAGETCVAELAGALGVELILSGNIVKSESGYVVTFRVLSTKNGEPVATATERHRTEDALLDWLDSTALELRRRVVAGARGGSSVGRVVAGILGGALVAAGGVLLGLSGVNYARLTGMELLPVETIAPLRARGEVFSGLGIGFVAAGGVGVLVSIVLAALAPSSAQTATRVIAGPVAGAGAFVGVSGGLP